LLALVLSGCSNANTSQNTNDAPLFDEGGASTHTPGLTQIAVPDPSDSSGQSEPAGELPQADKPEEQPAQAEDRAAGSPIEQLLGAEANPDELSALYKAAEIEVAEIATICIRRGGYDYVALPQPAPPAASFVENGKTDSDLVEEFGYAIWIVENAVKVLSESRTLVPIESRVTAEMIEDGQFLALRARCTGEARSQVKFFQQQSVPERVASMVAEFRSGLESDPTVVAKWTEWSHCMAQHGYEYADRQAIANDLGPAAGHTLARILELEPGPNFRVPPDLAADIASLRSAESIIIDADLGCAAEIGLDEFLSSLRLSEELAFVAEFGDQILFDLAASRAGQ